MNWRSFILGAVSGGLCASFAFMANAGYRALDEGVSITHGADEIAELRGESDAMRILLLDQIAGLRAADAEALAKRLGLFEDTVDNGSLIRVGIPDSAGRISLEIAQGKVVNVLNYCWRPGGDCVIFEASD